MTNLMSLSLRDDLESMMHIIVFLYNGTTPLIRLVHKRLDVDDSSLSLEDILEMRRDHEKEVIDQTTQMLPGSLKSAFSYIMSLGHKQKPDYHLIRLFFAQTMEEMQSLKKNPLNIDNQILFEEFKQEERKEQNNRLQNNNCLEERKEG